MRAAAMPTRSPVNGPGPVPYATAVMSAPGALTAAARSGPIVSACARVRGSTALKTTRVPSTTATPVSPDESTARITPRD